MLATLAASAVLQRAACAQTLDELIRPIATLTASDGAASDNFGDSISLSGDTLAVGVPFDQIGTKLNQGSVRVFVRSGSSWVLQATLTASDGAAEDYFGWSVSLSGDTLAIGVPLDDILTVPNRGSVRVFVRNGTTWTQQQSLSGVSADDQFGSAVALSGETLAVGAPLDDVGANLDQGSASVYTRSGTSWTLQQTLTASDGAAGDYFGWSVSLAGNTLAIGVPADRVGTVEGQGSVRIFGRNGTSWTAQQTLTASDGAANDDFGQAVALQGDTLAVGVASDDIGANADQGSVRMFARSGSVWTAQQTLTALDGAANDFFGNALALDGTMLAVGAYGDDIGTKANQGSTRIFAWSGTAWSAQATLTPADGATGDFFGWSVAMSNGTLAAAASADDVGTIVNQGSVRVFGVHQVWNATRSIGSNSLVSAIESAFAGDRLLFGNAAMSLASGIIDVSQKRLTFTALEPATLSPTALMTVANGTIFDKSPAVAAGGLTVAGKLVAPIGGELLLEQFTVASGGQFSQRGASIAVNQTLSTTAGGVCYLDGPVLAESIATASGAQNRVIGDTDILCDYSNAGATVIQRGIMYVYGSLTNSGTITGELNSSFLPPSPGDGYSIGGDYVVGASASVILADPVWWLRVGGNFDVAINDPARFVMGEATLELTGTGPAAQQSVEVLSRDLGETADGFAATNYPLGSLRLRAGANVSLMNSSNNAPGKGNEAIYTNELFVPAGATLTTNGYKIYTRVATIAGSVSNPNDIVVIEDAPPCVADIVTDGVVNGADLALLLVNWGPCASSTCIADIDRSGTVDAADLTAILVTWGACAN